MAKTKYEWVPLEEMDLDDGTHTCYSAATGLEPLQCDPFLYLTQLADDTWDVEMCVRGTSNFVTLVNCKTLTSAKRWVARYW